MILDAAAMLARAEGETGLSDYGDPTLPQRFAMAVDIFKAQGLDEDGQRKCAEVCHWLLTSRLEFIEDRNRYPIAEEKIVRPLFATGEPRSGTTLLHALLSVDPDSRSLRFWEVMYPSPPPGLAAPDDPRRARADDDWREINARMAKWLVCHPYNDMLGDGLPECERTWAFDFRVMTPTAWWRVPMGMIVQGLPVDPAAQMRLHRMMLQQLQYARPRKKWALKGFHGFRLGQLFDEYPDATILWSHRDPVQVTASRIMMAADITECLTGSVDIPALAKQHLAATRASIKATMEHPLIDDPRIFHSRYADFVKDQIGTIRAFYAHAGYELTPEAEAAMRDYLANNRGDRYGKFRYSTEVIGEDIDQLHEEFAPFRERFGVEIEQRH